MQKILFPYAKLNYFKGCNTNEPIGTWKDQCSHLYLTQISHCKTLQNPFKARSTWLYKARCQFIEHFTLKAPYMAKSTLALDENWPLSKYAA
jgi:hypothetical protein